MVTTSVPLFVNGEGMRGGSVHHTIAAHPFLGHVSTAPKYRFFSVGDRFPAMWLVDRDGVSVPGELYDVPLTTIRSDNQEISERVLREIVGLIEGGPSGGSVLMPNELVARRSSAPPPTAG